MFLKQAFLWLVFVFLMLCLYLVNRHFNYWTIRGVITVPLKSLLGHLEVVHFTSHVSLQVQELYNAFKGKGVIGGFFNCMRPNVILVDMDLIRDVLVRDFDYFKIRPLYFNPKKDPLGRTILANHGEEWKRQRAMLSPIFTSGKLKGLQRTPGAVAERFRHHVAPMADMKSEVEWRGLFGRFVSDIVGHIILGLDFNLIDNPESDYNQFRKNMLRASSWDRFKRVIGDSFPELAAKLQFSLADVKRIAFYRNLLRQTIEYREKNQMKRSDFVQLLLDIRREGEPNEGKLALEEMLCHTMMFLAAGVETTSSGLTFIAYELALHPDIQERAREEIRRVLKNHGGEMTYEAIQEMTYLTQVINENLRKNPLGDIKRKATKDYKIPGTDVTIEKGTDVWISLLGIHHDPDNFPEPEQFDPDRFTKENIAKRHSHAFMPFGDGPRICIGLRFAMLQMKNAIVTLLRDYKISPSEKTKIPIEINSNFVSYSPLGGVFLRIEKAE